MEGEVEADYLYATLLADDLVAFGWRGLRLVVLPIELGPDGKPRLLGHRDALERGNTGLAEWLRRAEDFWGKHRSSPTKLPLLERLNYQATLTS